LALALPEVRTYYRYPFLPHGVALVSQQQWWLDTGNSGGIGWEVEHACFNKLLGIKAVTNCPEKGEE